MRSRFRRRPAQAVTAVQLALDFDGFSYRKWGDTQTAQAGDWLVDNGSEVYTVAADSFARTYRQIGPGRWLKTGSVWAQQVRRSGSVATKEGRTHYQSRRLAGVERRGRQRCLCDQRRKVRAAV